MSRVGDVEGSTDNGPNGPGKRNDNAWRHTIRLIQIALGSSASISVKFSTAFSFLHFLRLFPL